MEEPALQGRSWEIFVRATKESNDVRCVDRSKQDFDREQSALSPAQAAYKNNEEIL